MSINFDVERLCEVGGLAYVIYNMKKTTKDIG